MLIATGAAAAGLIAYPLARGHSRPKNLYSSPRNQRYDGPLAKTIRDGLLATGIEPEQLRGKRVLLKPNMVEPTRLSPQLTTNPAMVLAAAEVFRDWGANVTVGEAPGHVRDTEMALVESGLQAALDDGELPFADLNYEEVGWTDNRGGDTTLKGFYFPSTVHEADLIVSMPKMKTHHWVGVTAAMKNMYGVIPGIVYGWPKNVLHYAGIPESVYDINASLPRTIAIVDGILCMEGDGPIMGSPKQMGLVIVGPELSGGRCHRGADHESAAGKRQLFGAGRRPVGSDRRSPHRSARRSVAAVGPTIQDSQCTASARPAAGSRRADFRKTLAPPRPPCELTSS